MPDLPADIRPFTGRFDGQTHLFALRVYFEDTDFSGIVYHANYLRYMERARSDMLRCVGIDQRGTFDADGGVYALADMHIRFQAPARLEDDLVVLSTVRRVRAAACHIHQRVMRVSQQAPDTFEPIAEADVVAAFVNRAGRPQRQPRAWVEAFHRVLVPEGAVPDTDKNTDADPKDTVA